VQNKSNLNPDPLWSAYHNTHPSLIERIRAIQAHKTKLDKKRE
jgi:Zn-dependent protease with chaperone function